MKFVMLLCLTEGTCECMVWMKDCPRKETTTQESSDYSFYQQLESMLYQQVFT